MVREINKDVESLSQKSEPFIIGQDDQILEDMLDTAEHYGDDCVGLACIQIGVPKRVVLVRINNKFVPFINPMIIKKSQNTYTVEEGCLSLEGTRTVRRHRTIKVAFTDSTGKRKVQEFRDFTAQILQHEIDHCNGVLI